jgi:hypothetical protein
MCTPKELYLSSATPSAPVVTFCPFEDSTMAPATGVSASSIAFTETLNNAMSEILDSLGAEHEASSIIPIKTMIPLHFHTEL